MPGWSRKVKGIKHIIVVIMVFRCLFIHDDCDKVRKIFELRSMEGSRGEKERKKKWRREKRADPSGLTGIGGNRGARDGEVYSNTGTKVVVNDNKPAVEVRRCEGGVRTR